MLRQPSMADGVVGYLSSGRGLTRVLVTVWFDFIKLILIDLTACHILWSSQHELSGRTQTWNCNFCQPGQILQLHCLDWFSLLNPSPSSAHTWSAKVGPIDQKSCSSNHYRYQSPWPSPPSMACCGDYFLLRLGFLLLHCLMCCAGQIKKLLGC